MYRLTRPTAVRLRLSPGLRHYHRHSAAVNTQPVTDDDIARLASQPLHPLTLTDLVRNGQPPLSADALLNSANFTLSILPQRLAHRIQALRNLPYIVMSNPHIARIHSNYMHSLSTLLPWSHHIDRLEDEIRFTQVMADLVQTHANTISILARGFLESRRYISPKDVTQFLEAHLRARIGTRLVAEQHIALHYSSQPVLDTSHRPRGQSEMLDEVDPTYIGVIDTALRPAAIAHQCASTVGEICELQYGVRPQITIDGEPEYTFAHIPVHLEYIITELLKNAFRATVEKGCERDPIQVTIAPLPEGSFSPKSWNRGDTFATEEVTIDRQPIEKEGGIEPFRPKLSSSTSDISASEHRTPGVTIRIRDRGGGIAPEIFPNIWTYSFTTYNEDRASSVSSSYNTPSSGADTIGALSVNGEALAAGSGPASSLAGLGYGLPLGRAYAEYFGGGIAVQSLWGWGTDVYLSLRGVGKIGD